MIIPKVTLTQYTIADLNDYTAFQSLGIADIRRKIDILLIDDEEFLREDSLRKNGFQITHKYDLEDIKDVAQYSVIMCDIRGVGHALGSDKEGAFLIQEIKKMYPGKQVTNSTYNPDYNGLLSYADKRTSQLLFN